MKFFDLMRNLYGFGELQKAGGVVLVRHAPMDYEKDFVSDIAQNFEKYMGIQQQGRRNQASRILGCEVVVSFCHPEFYDESGGHARFVGVFRNHSGDSPETLTEKHLTGLPPALTKEYFKDGNPPYHFFNFRRVAEFDDLKNRAVVNWPYGQNWVMRYNPGESQELEVREILPKGHVRPFPGVENFTLSFGDLREVVKSREWNDGLSVAGIYAICYNTGDKSELYIGSAYGKNGIIQRWRTYIRDGHGGNKELRQLPPDAKHHFKFSVLQALSPSMKASQVIRIENRWKEKLGSRHSLNRN